MVRNITSQDEHDLIDTAMNIASGGDVIAARIYDSNEDIVFDAGSITLIGGYDCDFLGHIAGEMTRVNSLKVTGKEK